jgi:adenylate kinase
MKNLLIFGKPGVGKNTQAEKICDKLNLFHITTGGLLREEMEKTTMLADQIRPYMEANQFVPERFVYELVLRTIREAKSQNKGVIFNGFPRNRDQAVAFSSVTAVKIDCIINLFLSDDLSITRQLERGRKTKNPRPEDLDPIAIRQRLRDYYAKTEPVLEYYRDLNVPILEIDGSPPIEEVTQTILGELGKGL